MRHSRRGAEITVQACLMYWDVGIIVYCTCGHFLRDDTTEEQEVHFVRAGSLLYPELPHKEGTVTKSQERRKKEGCKEFYTAKQRQKRCRKKQYENIHDRFIGDKLFRKTMIELGRSEEVILEMDQFAIENHSHIATEEEIDVYRGNWWIRSNLVNSDTMPMRRRLDFKKALSTLYRFKKTENKAHYENWTLSSSSLWQLQTTWWHPILRFHHKDGLMIDRTWKLGIISESCILFVA